MRLLTWMGLLLSSAVLLLAGPAAGAAIAPDSQSGKELSLESVPAEFNSYDEGWLTLEYHPSLSAEVRRLVDVALESRRDLSELLGRPVLDRVRVRIGRTPGEMETLAPKGGSYPGYASGVAYSALDLILLSATPKYPGQNYDLREIFRHELAHIALHDALGRDRVPRWFNEGFAVHASGEAETSRIQALWTATVADNLLPLSELTNGFPADGTTASVAYAQAADMVRFLLRRGEEHRFRDLLDRIARGQGFENALSDAYTTDLFTLERDWRRDVARRYTFWPVLFGGSMVWVLAIGLVVWGYVKRKRRNRRRLDEWAREEAAEDARRDLARAVLRQAGPVRVVLTSAGGAVTPEEGETEMKPREVSPALGPLPPAGPDVPKVEHDGGWHTLH